MASPGVIGTTQGGRHQPPSGDCRAPWSPSITRRMVDVAFVIQKVPVRAHDLGGHDQGRTALAGIQGSCGSNHPRLAPCSPQRAEPCMDPVHHCTVGGITERLARVEGVAQESVLAPEIETGPAVCSGDLTHRTGPPVPAAVAEATACENVTGRRWRSRKIDEETPGCRQRHSAAPAAPLQWVKCISGPGTPWGDRP